MMKKETVVVTLHNNGGLVQEYRRNGRDIDVKEYDVDKETVLSMMQMYREDKSLKEIDYSVVDHGTPRMIQTYTFEAKK